jgi:signal peptidase II
MQRLHWLTAAATSAAAVVIIDQGGKALVHDGLRICSAPPVALCDRIAIIGPLGVLRTINDNGAFGIIDASSLALLALAAMAVIGLVVRRYGLSLPLALAVGLLVGGSLGNLWDRVAFGTVTDFIDLRWGLADAGLVLNPADVALMAGGGMFWLAVLGRRPGRGGQSEVQQRAAASYVTALSE